jgi:hypothetical protein
MGNDELRKLLAEATPGPWQVDRTEDRWRAQIDGGTAGRQWLSLARVVVRMEGSTSDHSEGLANARLIAAAPDLAAEVLRLRDALRAIANLPDVDADNRGWMARNALGANA